MVADGGRELGRRDLGATVAIFWLALLPRLYVALAWAREPVWDGHYYDFGARRIAAGLGYSDDVFVDGVLRWHPWCHYPVGYSGFLAAIYAIFGAGPHVAPIANAFVGAALAAFVHRLARRGLSLRRARVAGVITALTPGLVLYAALVMTEPLAALGLVVSAWLAVRDDNAWRGAALGGVALGLSALVRPQSLMMAPAFVFLFYDRAREMKPSLKTAAARAAVALAVALLVIAPWTVRNCERMDGCALVSTNAGWNLAIGAFPRATGRFETLRAGDGCDDVTGQVDQDRCWLRRGVRWIEDEPGRWLALAPKKLGFTFDHESFPVGYLGEADPDEWPEPRRALYREILSGSHRVLLIAAALAFLARAAKSGAAKVAQTGLGVGLVALAALGASSDDHVYWPIAVAIPIVAALPLPGAPARGGVIAFAAWAIGSVAITHVIFFGEDRYHVVVTPLLALLAAAALRPAAAGTSRLPRAPVTASAAVAVIATALVGCKPGAPPPSAGLAGLAGTVLEVAVRGDVVVARLDARGCPVVSASTRADLNGAAMQRADDADAGFGVEARGCSGRWTLVTKDLPKGNAVITIADEGSKLVVETLPLTQKAGFKLLSRPSLNDARAGDKVVVETRGPGSTKLVRAEAIVTTRSGDKLKLPSTDVTVGGGTVGLTLPSAWPNDGGREPLAGELTVSAESDAVIRCDGPVRCVAPLRTVTSFALSIRPDSAEK